MIERIHLSILREIERHQSLTAAGTALNLSQSALSHAIKKLETRANTLIWEKEGRGIRLTQAGEHLLKTANRLLPQLEYAEKTLEQFSSGSKGFLRIGMECHPCYRWLMKIVGPYLGKWPDVDLDIKQRFRFGGLKALMCYEIDVVVTPDPVKTQGCQFFPVFDYEPVLVVSKKHALASKPFVKPCHLQNLTLLTYPVSTERLDIYTQFLLPAGQHCRYQKTIESTDIMLQMVASNRGVASLPRWLVEEYATSLDIEAIKLGPKGIAKKIHLGIRKNDIETNYITSFLEMAKQI